MKNRYDYLRGSAFVIVGWPLFCLAVALLAWHLLFAELANKRDALRTGAVSQASGLARSYAAQLSQAVGYLDERTRSLAFEWHESAGGLRLERRADAGIYQKETDLVLGVSDASGDIVTSLPPQAARNIGLAGSPQFLNHQRGAITGLQIRRIEHGQFIQKPIVVFSRNLKSADDAFAGIAFITVTPDYLASFQDGGLQGKNDVVAVMTREGMLLASIMGENVRSLKTIARTPVKFDSDAGTAAIPGSAFVDGLPRIVAWHAVNRYPLVSVVALAESDVFAPLDGMRRERIRIGAALSVLLALLAFMGAFFSARMAFRRHQENIIKTTYRLATDNAREAFFMLRKIRDPQGRLVDLITEDCNERGSEFLNGSRRETIGSRISKFYPDKVDRVISFYLRALEAGHYEDEFQVREPGPFHGKWMRRRIVSSGDEGIAVTLRDISEAKEHEQALVRIANRDTLTQLPNRHWLNSYLPDCLARAERSGGKVALLFIDLDDFKNINNTKGHAAGDAILHAAGQRMKDLMRPGDHVVRLGGDEFTVILERVADEEQAARIAARLGEALSEPCALGEHGIQRFRASIGISLYPEHGRDMETLLQHADIAMYAAKAGGKGRHQVYAPDFSQAIVHKVSTLQALRHALDVDEFVLHYQPRADARTGALRSFEALLRWKHPERGMVPPLEFIPLAEESGLIVELGALVLEKVCRQLAAWRALRLPVKPVSVNVSARQFQAGSLGATVSACLARHGVPARLLELEITESCMMEDRQRVAEELAGIKAMGVRISVDDFGTGYSSLSQLQQLGLDVMKVDRAFTAMLTKGERHQAFFMTILAMARSLKMEVVAEGVETAEQLKTLQDMSCDEVQGYFIARPVPADDVPAFLQGPGLFRMSPRGVETG